MAGEAYIQKGATYEIDGKVYECLEFLHVKPGKGAAFVRTKMKDVINGGVVEMTFNPSKDIMKKAYVDKTNVTYSWNDGEFYHFYDDDGNEVLINMEDVADEMRFIKEGEQVMAKSYQGKIFSVEPPLTVELTITQAEPAVKGNTATGARKEATVETGATVQVPLFVEEGETIKIDTRTGEYLSRA